jgi:hypothetical protein
MRTARAGVFQLRLEMTKQIALFDIQPLWKDLWLGMPEYDQQNLMPFKSIKVHFLNREDQDAFAAIMGQTITEYTQFIWYPKAEIGRISDKRYVTNEPKIPRYPIYVISKGRWESRLTAKSLEAIDVAYRIVIEPQEYDEYSAVIDPHKILVLPFANLGQGSIPARNWVWEHSIKEGHERHWILDDNINGFYRLNKNLKVPVSTGSTFCATEDFADRFTNIALCGFNYFMFAKRKDAIPPFVLNTRIYSCILIQNDLSHRWRGRYNEDTDLSLRVLKDGFCTVLFNAFLAMKQTTMTMGGGNTDELYKGDGRLVMAESLKQQHPDVVKVTRKWNRWQHSVNYRPFAVNKLILRCGVVIPESTDNYGMSLEIDE